MAEPYRRGDKWAFTIDVPRELTGGKRKQLQRSGFKTKKEAQQEMVKLLNEMENGVYADKTNVTLSEYLDYYYENYVQLNNSEHTAEKKRYLFERIAKSQIGGLRLQQLQAHQLQSYVTYLVKEKGLAPSTVELYMTQIKHALKMAQIWKMIKFNPFNDVVLPKVEYEEADPLTPQQLSLIAEDIQASVYSEYIQLALFSGMRVGEIAALDEKQDIDFVSKEIKISKTVHKISGKGIVIKHSPKSESSKRRISFDSVVEEILRRALVKKAKMKLKAGPLFVDQGLVFSTETGRALNPQVVSGAFKKILRKAGLDQFTFHSLRHAHASLLLELGFDIKVIQKRLGHKKSSTTYDTYAHLMPHAERDAAQSLESSFRKLI